MKLPRAWLCSHCGHIDDLDGPRCPCPHDGLAALAQAREVTLRHRQAVARARHRVERMAS